MMHDELPFHLLELLASKREQVRYIEHANKDEYLLPTELLNDAWHFCERALSPLAICQLSPDQLAAIKDLQTSIKLAPETTHDNAQLLSHPDWIGASKRALAVLAAFGKPLSV